MQWDGDTVTLRLRPSDLPFYQSIEAAGPCMHQATWSIHLMYANLSFGDYWPPCTPIGRLLLAGRCLWLPLALLTWCSSPAKAPETITCYSMEGWSTLSNHVRDHPVELSERLGQRPPVSHKCADPLEPLLKHFVWRRPPWPPARLRTFFSHLLMWLHGRWQRCS